MISIKPKDIDETKSTNGIWKLVKTESDEGKDVARDAANGVGEKHIVIEPGRYIENSESFYADMMIKPVHWCIQGVSEKKITYTIPLESYAPGSNVSIGFSQGHHSVGYRYSYDDAQYSISRNSRGETVYVKTTPGPLFGTDDYEVTTGIGTYYDDIAYKGMDAKGNTTITIPVPTLNEVAKYKASTDGMPVDETADHYFSIKMAGTKFTYKWVH
jgi:hypothetical protein